MENDSHSELPAWKRKAIKRAQKKKAPQKTDDEPIDWSFLTRMEERVDDMIHQIRQYRKALNEGTTDLTFEEWLNADEASDNEYLEGESFVEEENTALLDEAYEVGYSDGYEQATADAEIEYNEAYPYRDYDDERYNEYTGDCFYEYKRGYRDGYSQGHEDGL